MATKFQVGELYAISEIQGTLGVGNAGGVRVALDRNRHIRRLVLLTALPTAKIAHENPYHDRIESGVLVYTGAGLQGDQSLGGMNKRILQQREERFPVYGFRLQASRRKTGPKRWEFLGLLQFLRYYPDSQVDEQSLLRKVWVFELQLCIEPHVVVPEDDLLAMQTAWASSETDGDSEERVVKTEPESVTEAKRAEARRVESARRELLGLSPQGFEEIVKVTLVKTGFERVIVTKFSQDGGVDVDAFLSQACWPLLGLHLQVQAKRWLHTVGRREVAELRGSLRPHARGALITTSHFSRAALLEASESGKSPIVLVDGFTFARTALGVSVLQG